MALDRLLALVACLPCGAHHHRQPDATPPCDEKASLLSHDVAVATANDVVATLLTTSSSGPALRMELDSNVGAYGWRQHLAELILDKLAQVLQTAHEKLGPSVNSAYQRAVSAVAEIEGFVIEHPVISTVVALGVLALLAPWVLDALGFADLGPAAGKSPGRRRTHTHTHTRAPCRHGGVSVCACDG